MATRMLVEAQARAPIAALWGDGSTSSSDGQHFPSAGRARGVSTVNLRYGGEPGVKFYTHVSDQFAPFATRAIAATAAEAPHVLDGLLRHGGRTPIREHHTDTGGFSDHIFALCALLGYRFAPRIRDLPEKRLYVLESSPPAPTLAPLIAHTARLGQIRAAWPQLVQLAASIRSGQVSAAHAVATLAATMVRSRRSTAQCTAIGQSSTITGKNVSGVGGRQCLPSAPSSSTSAATQNAPSNPPRFSGRISFLR